MYQFGKAVIFVFTFLAFSSFAAADPFKTQRSTFAFLKNLYGTIDLEKMVKTKMAPNSIHHDKYEDYLKVVLLDDEIIEALSELVFDNKALLMDNPELAASLGSNWALSSAMKGITRLSDENQRFLLELTLLQAETLDTNSCSSMFGSDLTNEEMTSMGFTALERMPSRVVDAYLKLLQEALFAEVRDSPMSRDLTVSEQELADAAFEKSYVDALLNHSESEELIAAATDPKLASDFYICENGKVLLESILSIKGYTGGLAIRNLMSQTY